MQKIEIDFEDLTLQELDAILDGIRLDFSRNLQQLEESRVETREVIYD